MIIANKRESSLQITKKKILALIKGFVIIVITAFFVSPLYISFIYSLKTNEEIGAKNPLSLPKKLYFGNYHTVITQNSAFKTGLINSIITTIFIVLILTFVCSMAAYVLARNKGKSYSLIYSLFMAGILVPFQCIMFPTYVNLRNMGIMNTLLAFILVRIAFQIPICILIITGFVKSVPVSLEEAALIDGCNSFQLFWCVVFPLMKPINFTMLVLNTLFSWNDFYVSVTILQSSDKRTLPLAQFVYISESAIDIGLAFAFFILCMLPVLIIYFLAQKHIVSGIMTGAVKE